MLWHVLLSSTLATATLASDGGVHAENAAEGIVATLRRAAADAGSPWAPTEWAVEHDVVPPMVAVEPAAPLDAGHRFTADLDDEALAERVFSDVRTLGSLSIGLAEDGRLVNGVPMPEGEEWFVTDPEGAFGAQETIDALVAAAKLVRAKVPGCAPLRINHISQKHGGHLKPHRSHQSGRDADLGLYYLPGQHGAGTLAARVRAMDKAANWELLKAVLTVADVQVVLLDKRVQKVLYDYALASGEDRAWLDRLFKSGPSSIVHHANGHADHFHVRFYAPRSQELARRVLPLLSRWGAKSNVVAHAVKPGETLAGIAARYGSSTRAIVRVNRLASTLVDIGSVLQVPVLAGCRGCKVPPPVVMRKREVPPGGSEGASHGSM